MTAPKMFTLRILPDQRTLQAPAHAHLHEALDQHGISLTAHCDGMGLCGKCCVRITYADGRTPDPTPADLRALSPDQLARGLRLACMWRVSADAVIEIPPTSRIGQLRILSDSLTNTPPSPLPPPPRP
ncbi:MAG: 2Fe-2S iron-sulfur cluster-binding protein, partial [bacterium]|nr:2Fe-2S iron-sulfur cluster-binding protein [bacterium]